MLPKSALAPERLSYQFMNMIESPASWFDSGKRSHPRTIGWGGTTALAMGGSNQMIFLITAFFIGQGDILGQGSAAVPLADRRRASRLGRRSGAGPSSC